MWAKLNRTMNMYTKVVMLLLLVLIPVFFLFSYSFRVSTGVIQNSLKTNNFNNLGFLVKQMDGLIYRLSTNAITFSNDPLISELRYYQKETSLFDQLRIVQLLQAQIDLQGNISPWNRELTIFLKDRKMVISNSSAMFEYDVTKIPAETPNSWRYRPSDSPDRSQFVFFTVHPFSNIKQLKEADVIVQIGFQAIHLRNMLDDYKSNGKGDPFLYNPTFGVLANHSANLAHMEQLARYLKGRQLGDRLVGETVTLDERDYLISYQRSDSLDWYLIDYIPLQDVLAPITETRNLFYGSTFLLLVFSVYAAFILYRHVQIPIRRLTQSLYKIKKGDYSTRLGQPSGGKEMVFLFDKFNDMAQQIQDLVERVYEERIQSRQAQLKQLQSQINPHFLYNCLFFIKSSAVLGDQESVVAMSLNLGEYFRYTTRLAQQSPSLGEELQMVGNYLFIQNLRMSRIRYEIRVPEDMADIPVPRLFLQPIVENAILHGIEPSEQGGQILIAGEREDGSVRITVEDDGGGLSDKAMGELNFKIKSKEEDELSCGLWNVSKRLQLMYGEGAGIRLSRSSLGGLKVTVVFETREENGDVQSLDRR